MNNRRHLLLRLGEIELDPDQPRKRFDERPLLELASSIDTHGLLEPLVVTDNDRDAERPYLLIAGERRYRAAELAGVEEVEAIYHSGVVPYRRIMMALEENDQREPLTLLERAEALRRAFELSPFERSADFARAIHRSQASVSHLLWVARSTGTLRQAVEAGAVTRIETARLFARLPPSAQTQLLAISQHSGAPIPVRQLEQAVDRHERQRLAMSEPPRPSSPNPIQAASVEKRTPHPAEPSRAPATAFDAEELLLLASLLGLPTPTSPSAAFAAIRDHLRRQKAAA